MRWTERYLYVHTTTAAATSLTHPSLDLQSTDLRFLVLTLSLPPPPARFGQIVSAAFGSSAAITSSSNGGLPSGRSRSPGFEVESKQQQQQQQQPSSSSPGSEDAAAAAAASSAAAAAAFLVGGAAGEAGRVGGGGASWLGGGGDDLSAAGGRKEVDHAFAGAMLQRSTSAPPVSDHVRTGDFFLRLCCCGVCSFVLFLSLVHTVHRKCLNYHMRCLWWFWFFFGIRIFHLPCACRLAVFYCLINYSER